MKIFKGEKTIVKSWCENVESGAIDQAKNLASLPFVFKHIALMPDCHQGFGMPIGGVMATQGVVVPNAVGVDIGCGMCAVKTSLKVDDLGDAKLREIMGEIRRVVPVGKNWNEKQCDNDLMPSVYHIPDYDESIISKQFDRARQQLGTLGGGNHFIEIQADEEDFVWIMIHSGSRNLGKQVADHYNAVAKELNKKYSSSVPSSWDLAFLPLDSEEGQKYLTEMQYCVDFALANRKLMMDNVLQSFAEVLKVETIFNVVEVCKNHVGMKGAFEVEEMINIAHNYARLEHHFGQNVMVHRKGATSAKLGEIGIIPGSQGTCSYIVRGLGTKDSFESCSHGAGRMMGRKVAKETLNLEEEIKKLDDQGIVHGIRNTNDLDEASGAYKDIDVVMEEQKDLVEILVKLRPLGVVKG